MGGWRHVNRRIRSVAHGLKPLSPQPTCLGRVCELERFGQASLLEHAVSGVARFDIGVYRKVLLRMRAEPDLVIALARPHRITARVAQNPFQVFRKSGHGAGMLTGDGDFLLPVSHYLVAGTRPVRFKQLGHIQLKKLGHANTQ